MTTATDFKTIALKEIRPDDNQPRKIYDETAMQELVASVKEKGVLQPILIRPNGKGYILVCGERRYRASKEAGLEEIPAVIRTLSDEEALELQIIENLQRKDVHPMEEAVAFKSLLENKIRPLSIEEIAAKVGKSVYFVKQRLKLNALNEDWQRAFFLNKLTSLQAIGICQLSLELQKELFKDKTSYQKDWEKRLDFHFNISDWDIERRQMKLNSAPFDKKDETLNPKMGACTNCPFNSAVACLFPEDAKDPVCNNAGCYKIKTDVSFDRKLKVAADDPAIVLVDNEYYRYGKDERLEKLIKAGYKIYSYGKSEYTRIATSDKSYKEGLKTGKVLKAFVVAGDSTGKHIYVTLKTKKAAGNVSENRGADEIAEEIKRIKDREKRAKELDGEKVWTKIRGLIPENVKALFSPEPLSQSEREALAEAIEDKISFSNRDWIDEHFGSEKEFAGISESGINILCRMFMLDVLPTAYGSHLSDGSSNYHAYQVLKQYLPNEIAAIELEQQEVASKRKGRVEKRLEDLIAKKRQLQTTGKKGAESDEFEKAKKHYDFSDITVLGSVRVAANKFLDSLPIATRPQQAAIKKIREAITIEDMEKAINSDPFKKLLLQEYRAYIKNEKALDVLTGVKS